MIRDRLVCGVNDVAIQRRLLAEPTLTYEKAVELALSAETAARSVRELKSRPEQETPTRGILQDVHKLRASPSATPSNPDTAEPTCYRCGKKGHKVSTCRVDKDIVCRKCHKKGHLQRACKSRPWKKKDKPKSVRRMEESGESEEDKEEWEDVRRVSAKTPPFTVQVKLDGVQVDMEVDTGASVSLMSESTFKRIWPQRSLEPSQVHLRTYLKEPIPVVGCTQVNIEYNTQSCSKMPLLIVAGAGPTLLGRDWLATIRLDWKGIHRVYNAPLLSVLDRYPDVFSDGLGKLKGFQAKIYVDPDAVPSFHPPRSVPFALRDKVEQELEQLQEQGILEPVEIAEWAAPIVVVLKKDCKRVRICGDFSVTVNPVSKLDRYPIPKIDDLFARLSKGKLFSKLDLSQAYQQLTLDEESKKYVVINTHRGLFRYTRLPFGIASAPGIFQRVIESLLQGINGVVVYLDDILITGDSEEAHLKALDEVLSRLDRAGLRVKRSKCEFMRPSVTYLGHRIDANGLHTLHERVRAVQDAPAPTSVSGLKSYLGMLTYYSKFLPNLSTTLHPLYQLLRKDVPWRWGHAEAKAFVAAKELLTSSGCLTHFDSSVPLTLACDASSYGLGAVLTQQGWPTEDDPELEPYSSRRLELSSYEGCVLWGARVVIPPPGREAVIQELHEGHPGISRMKGLSRMYVWWPGITADIEKSVRLCRECQQVQSSPPLAPLHPWKWPTRPWARLHLDFAGPFEGKNILVVIDAHSKWIEAMCTSSMSSTCVIEEMRSLFARFGLPEMVVTDNGTCFVSSEFKQFLSKQGIRHTTSAPYHPASNGLAERAVQIIKRGLKKVTKGTMQTRLAKVLFSYRVTPQSTTGQAPAELLLGRRPRTCLDLLRPNTSDRVERRQLQQKQRHDGCRHPRTFRVGDSVFVRNHGVGSVWLPGKIVRSTGPVSFMVVLEDGRNRRCHQDQLRLRVVSDGPPEMSQISVDAEGGVPISVPTPATPSGEAVQPEQGQNQPVPTNSAPTNSRSFDTQPTDNRNPSQPTDTHIRRYPLRQRKTRDRFEPGMN